MFSENKIRLLCESAAYGIIHAMSAKNIENYKSGERILTKGDKAEKAFIIRSGKVRVFLEKDGKKVTLAELTPDELFGEAALFDDQFIYGANVEASEDAALEVVTPQSFQYELEVCNPTLRTIIRMLIERQRNTNEALLKSETREFMDLVLVHNTDKES